jgi:hypothetical protein
MTDEEWRAFVMTGTRTGKVGVTRDDRRNGHAVRDLAEVRKWATVLGGRYMGADRADEYGARNGVPGELLVRLRAGNVVAMRDIAD